MFGHSGYSFMIEQAAICLIWIQGVLVAWIVACVFGHRLLGEAPMEGRTDEHTCSSCSYDLAENGSGVCPECGLEVVDVARPGNMAGRLAVVPPFWRMLMIALITCVSLTFLLWRSLGWFL